MSQEITMVECPTCGELVAWVPANPYRPFCSERCKLIDLGAWANEDYTMAAEEAELLSDDIVRH